MHFLTILMDKNTIKRKQMVKNTDYFDFLFCIRHSRGLIPTYLQKVLEK